MLNSDQIETISGITCNYKDYVVYYFDDYFEYPEPETIAADDEELSADQPVVDQANEDLIIIYVGSGFTLEDNTFYFGEDAACYKLTYNKYLDRVPMPTSFTVAGSEMVYTNLASDYPDLTFWENKFVNSDFKSWLVFGILLTVGIDVVLKVVFGGKE